MRILLKSYLTCKCHDQFGGDNYVNLLRLTSHPFSDILTSIRYWVIHSVTVPSLFIAGWLLVSTGLAYECVVRVVYVVVTIHTYNVVRLVVIFRVKTFATYIVRKNQVRSGHKSGLKVVSNLIYNSKYNSQVIRLVVANIMNLNTVLPYNQL